MKEHAFHPEYAYDEVYKHLAETFGEKGTDNGVCKWVEIGAGAERLVFFAPSNRDNEMAA